ncbi:MAG: hypothetical protein KatS3mg022_3567 [Armatimonadota bacterium]|nr:MAG: hypothetical protein KatS3mg022_3567 [Armatimonadota bacterium]
MCELDASGNAVAPVVFGANGLVVYSGYIYQFDPQGNAVHVLDDDGRTVLANLAYDAWGQLMSGSNPTPYGYKAQWGYTTDVETGILLLTHRYLDPAMGRFLTRDPIGLEGGVNLYAYCRNRVVMLNDRSGTIGFFPVVCSACAVCLTGFALSCYDCGLDASCWMNCVSNIWQNLPTWVKILCGGACIGCGARVILPDREISQCDLSLAGQAGMIQCSIVICLPSIAEASALITGISVGRRTKIASFDTRRTALSEVSRPMRTLPLYQSRARNEAALMTRC